MVISAGRARSLVSSGVFVKDKWWYQNFVAPNHPEYLKIKGKLDECMRISGGIINLLPENATPSDIKKKYLEVMREREERELKDLNIKIEYNIIKDFEDFIERRRPIFKHNTIKKYVTTLNTLLDYEAHTKEHLDIDTFNKLIFERFVSFLILHKNLLNNTVAKHVSVLKAFFRDTYPDFNTSFMVFHEYRPEVIALSEKELIYLINIPFSGPKEIAKDLFVFLCLTGMRISDVRRFNPKWVTDEMIEYSAEKTMSKAYVPLLETAQGILEKYGGEPPKMCEQYFNRKIKKVFFDCGMDRAVVLRKRQGRRQIEEIHPLHEVVSSHTGRKTFVSMMLARGVPIQDVMNMSGHQDYRSMLPYIQVDRELMKKYKNLIEF